MSKLSERGIIQFIIPLILLAGMAVGVYLITSGNPLKLFSKASNPPIVFKSSTGASLPLNSAGVPTSTSLTVKIELTSTLGAPATPSYTYPTPSSTSNSSAPTNISSGGAVAGSVKYAKIGGTTTNDLRIGTGVSNVRIFVMVTSGNTFNEIDTRTDGSGNFTILNIPAGKRDVVIEDKTLPAGSYSIIGSQQVTVNDGQTTTGINLTASLPTASSPPVSGPISTGTVSYKIAETPTDLNTAPEKLYTKEPTVIDYTFKNATLGSKFIWVEFKDNTGKTDRKSAQLEIIAAPSGGTGSGFGKAISLDGQSSITYSSVDSDALDIKNASTIGTMQMWVKMDQKNLKRTGTIIYRSGDRRCFDLATNGSGTLAFYMYGQQFFSQTPLMPGKWYHIAVVNDFYSPTASDKRGTYIYLNGKVDGFRKMPTSLDSNCQITKGPIMIGSSSLGFIGELDEVNFDSGILYLSEFTVPSKPHTGGSMILHFDGDFNDVGFYKIKGQGYNVQFVDSTIGGGTPSPSPSASPTPTPTPTPSSGKASPCPPIGDVNDDKVITNADAQAAGQIVALVAPYQNPTADQIKRADVDADGRVTSTDSLRILRYIKGFDATFKACAASLPKPNLVVEKVTLAGDPGFQKVGQSIDLDVVIKNYGNADVSANTLLTTKVAIKKPDGTAAPGCSPQVQGPLAAGRSTLQHVTDCGGKYEAAGNYNVNVTADSANVVDESNEQDNTIIRSASVQAASIKPTPTPTPTPIPTPFVCTACGADINKDGGVDTGDYSYLTSCFNKKATDKNSKGLSCAPADIDGSGTVDRPDNTCLLSQFGKRCSGASTSAKRVFVTSNSYNGDLKSAGSKYGLGTATSGLDGADKICQGTANIAKLGGSWKAWLSDNTTAASSRLTQNKGSYKLLNGTVVADNWTDLTDGTIKSKIDITEYGQVRQSTIGAGTYVWTNSSASGNIVSTSTSCNNWTARTGQGIFGNYSSTDSKWSVGSARAGDGILCDLNTPAVALYCFEQ